MWTNKFGITKHGCSSFSYFLMRFKLRIVKGMAIKQNPFNISCSFFKISTSAHRNWLGHCVQMDLLMNVRVVMATLPGGFR